MVLLATCTKQNIYEIIKDYEVSLNGFPARINLNILPLGSYDVLIGMDWLEQHHLMLDFLHKSILCTDSQWNQTKIQGIPMKVSVRQISSVQVKRKGYKMFAVNI